MTRETIILGAFLVVGLPYFLVKWSIEALLEWWDRRTLKVVRWAVHPMDMRRKR